MSEYFDEEKQRLILIVTILIDITERIKEMA
jgi:hypothetical protein